jgi:hypothetical protein
MKSDGKHANGAQISRLRDVGWTPSTFGKSARWSSPEASTGNRFFQFSGTYQAQMASVCYCGTVHPALLGLAFRYDPKILMRLGPRNVLARQGILRSIEK